MDEFEPKSAGPIGTSYSEGGELGEYWTKHLSTTAGGITGSELGRGMVTPVRSYGLAITRDVTLSIGLVRGRIEEHS
jgi:hypothetical protein